MFSSLSAYCFSWLRCLPSVRDKITGELDKTGRELEQTIHEHDETGEFLVHLNWEGTEEEQILARMDRYQQQMGGGKFDYKKVGNCKRGS